MVIMMAANNKFKHLTGEERRIIQVGIENGSTQKAIADTIGKQKSTIGKEIKQHRVLSYKCRMPVECAVYRKCRPAGSCIGASCPNFIPFTCNRRDHSPGACNGCSQFVHCRFSKYTYNAEKAQLLYEETLKDSRMGANLTTEEAAQIANTIAPLLRKGQSPYTILQNHPELQISERALYYYLEKDILHYAGDGVTNMDLRRQVSRRRSKKQDEMILKKRDDRSFLKGRTYRDYLAYLQEHPDISVVQMDTVYNVQEYAPNRFHPVPPYLQTFKFLEFGFLFALFHEDFSADAMKQGVDLLESILSPPLFFRHVQVMLTDRGGEFYLAEQIEHSGDDLRTRLFYCDPQAANQKGSLENNHIELRYICPKHVDLTVLGLDSQAKLNLALSHINSTRKEHLHGKTPFELMEFMEPDLYQKFIDFGLQKIEGDKVVLKPYLLK